MLPVSTEGRRPRKEAKKGPLPAHYSAGKLVVKDSGSVVIPISRATVQTVYITQVNALASLTQKNPLRHVMRGCRVEGKQVGCLMM